MKETLTFHHGGKIEFTVDGCVITSTAGEVFRFGGNGSLVSIGRKYFFHMGKAERMCVRKWLDVEKPVTEAQETFLHLVKDASNTIAYSYWISAIEPSALDGDKITYKPGKPVLRGLTCHEWEKRANAYAPELGSQLATWKELYLWYGYRVAVGEWSLEYICDDSSSAGNYWNSPEASHNFEKSGARKVGGFNDGVGNTYKIVKDSVGNYFYCGGIYNFSGKNNPVALAEFCQEPLLPSDGGVGVVVLKKP